MIGETVKVKICGITNLDDARAAAELGADLLGFNFYPKSPRYISPSEVGNIIRRLPEEVEKVGVFVNASVEEIVDAASICGLSMIQLHGDEDGDVLEEVRRRAGIPVVRVIRVNADTDVARLGIPAADEYLLDSKTRSYGGSGEVFDWRIAVEIKKLVPRFLLAGGLVPENIGDAIRRVRPWGVDVSSGVESEPGKKDLTKLSDFIRNARTAL